jgi:hypothetical protein
MAKTLLLLSMLIACLYAESQIITRSAVLAPRFSKKRDEDGRQIWNLDEDPNVLRVDCSLDLSEVRVERNVNDIPAWQQGDVISGSPSWGCLKNGKSYTILVEVQNHIVTVNNVTLVTGKTLELTDVFQDLSIDIKTTNKPNPATRRHKNSVVPLDAPTYRTSSQAFNNQGT